MVIELKVLILGSKEYPARFRTSACGGIEVHVESVVKHLTGKGVDAYLVSRSIPGERNVEHATNLHIYRVPCVESRLLRTFSLNLLACVASVFLITRHRVELLHANDFTSGLFASILKALFRRPLLLSVPTFGSLQPDWPPLVKKLLAIFERFSIASSDVIFLFSPTDARYVERRYPRGFAKVRLLGNAVDLAGFSSLRYVEPFRMFPGLSPDTKIVLFIGRLVKSKGLAYLLKAFQEVSVTIPSVLIIVGDGPERKHLEDDVKRRQLENRVVFVGKRAEVRDFLLAADLFVLPSLYEGFPLSLLEAMASGKPVLATKVGAIPFIIQDGVNGILAEPGNAEQLSKGIKLLLEQPDLRARMGHNAFETVKRRHNWAALSETIYEAYNELVGRDTTDGDKKTNHDASQVHE